MLALIAWTFLSSLKNGIDFELSTKIDKIGFSFSVTTFSITGFIKSKINKNKLNVFRTKSSNVTFGLFFTL